MPTREDANARCADLQRYREREILLKMFKCFAHNKRWGCGGVGGRERALTSSNAIVGLHVLLQTNQTNGHGKRRQ